MANQIQVNVGINSAGFRSGLASMRKYTADFRDDVRSQLTGAIAGFALLTTAVQTLKRAIMKGAEMEGFTAQFKTLLGSVEEAKKRMDELSKFAASTPFALPEIAAASRVLETLTNGAMSTGEGLRIVGDAAATAKRPFEEIAVVIGRVYAGIQQGSNTIGAEINRLIELGLVSNETKIKLQGLMEAGKKGGEVWAIVAQDLGRFSGQMEEMSATLEGKLSTMGDAFDEMLRRFSQPLMDTLKSEVDRGTSALEAFGDVFQFFGEETAKTWNAFMAGVTLMVGVLATAVTSVTAYFNVIVESAKAAGSVLKDVLTGNFDGIVDRANDAGEKIKAAFKAGFDQVKAEVAETRRIIDDTLVPLKTGPDGKKPEQATPQSEADAAASKQEEKNKERLAKIQEREREAARDKLDTEEKINALIEERDKLLREAESIQDESKALDNLEEAQKLQREIEREQKRLADKKAADEKKAADKRKKEAEDQDKKDREAVMDIAQAREDEAKARREDELAQMTPQERLLQFQKEKTKLEKDAANLEETDPAAAARKRTEAIDLGGKIRDEQGKIEDQRKAKEDQAKNIFEEQARKSDAAKQAAASVPVSSLQAVGGGGRAGPASATDPVLRENQKQVQYQQQILEILRTLSGSDRPKQQANDKYL